MKQIFLMGDSIRMGYGEKVRQLLSDRAAVHFPEENGRFTLNTLCFLPAWAQAMCGAAPEDIDLVHWNCGLWDVCHFEGDPLPLVPPDVYENALRRIIARIGTVFPNAGIVFALTTGVDEKRTKYQRGVPMRTQAEIDAYNRIAARVMEGEGIPLDPLDEISGRIPDEYRADWVHFTPAGYEILARRVALSVRRALNL